MTTTTKAEYLAYTSTYHSKLYDELESRGRSDALEARAERDEAVRALEKKEDGISRLNEKLSESQFKITTRDEEIARLENVVAQLREEVIEHKEQLKVWQDSFLRADRERSSLSVRLQEVVEVLQSVPRHSSSIDTAPMTPVSRYADDAESSAYQSASTSRPGTTKLPLSPPDHDTPAHHQPAKAYRRTANTTVVTKTPMRHETAAREPKPKPWPLPSTSSSTPRDITQPSTSRVIRHVTAVVRVKREEDASDDERLRAPPSRSQSVYEEEVVQRHRTRERSSAAKRRIIYDEDYEEAEQDSAGESDEEDDPLMMGVEFAQTPRRPRAERAHTKPAPPSKKRKLTPNPNAGGRALSTRRKA